MVTADLETYWDASGKARVYSAAWALLINKAHPRQGWGTSLSTILAS
jgi:hypothetical protein